MANLFSIKRTLLALGFGLWVTGNAALAAEPDLAGAEALMKQGKAAEAYLLLEPFEFELSGNINYDYLLGIAALDSGKPDKATIAFERVLAVDPNHAGARLDMGRAYFALGDFARAKTEFDTVLTQDPPPAARTVIANYMAAMQKQESAKQTKASGYIEASVGHDSNVNFATSQSQIAVPALGNLMFTLNPGNVRAPDNYFGVNLGGEISHQFVPKFGIYAGADVRVRDNRTENTFSSNSLDGRAGISLGEGVDVVRLGLLGGKFELDGKNNRDTSGASVEWRHLINPANQLNTFGQFARYRFEPTISVNDFDQTTVGMNWLHVFNDGKGVISTTFFSGKDDAPLRADGDKSFVGVRFGGQIQISEKVEFFAGLGAQASHYRLANAAFSPVGESLKRGDRQLDASLGFNWHLDKFWTLRPQVTYLRNNSNIVIYEHDRTDVSITLRRDFK